MCVHLEATDEAVCFPGVLSTRFLFLETGSLTDPSLVSGSTKSVMQLQRPCLYYTQATTKPKVRVPDLWIWKAFTSNGIAKGIVERRWFQSIL